jgi:glyoxylase-like metal-dependent hydrolase (beta-lactamase superfamily II)
VKTFDGEVELFPGLRTVAGYGHTPGQTYFVLQSNGETLVFWGDTIHVQDVQFADPSVTVKFDVDPKAAAAQRKLAFADAAKNGYLVALDHVYFPGVGHIQKEGDHYRWIPVPYTNDSQKPR